MPKICAGWKSRGNKEEKSNVLGEEETKGIKFAISCRADIRRMSRILRQSKSEFKLASTGNIIHYIRNIHKY